MATPPTFVADYEATAGWANTASPHVTGSFNGSLGDVLTCLMGSADNAVAGDYTTTSSPAETWTEKTAAPSGASSDVWLQPATTVLTAARTGMTVTMTKVTGSSVPLGHDVAHFTGSDGIGASAASTGAGVAAPSLSITTQFDNSAIVYMVGDWAATDATTRTHRTVNGFTPTAANGKEFTYFRDTINWMVVCAYIPDAGAAGAKSVGISAPATGDCEVVAVEVRGSAGTAAAKPNPHRLIMPAVHRSSLY
jgi:hypothetical protein